MQRLCNRDSRGLAGVRAELMGGNRNLIGTCRERMEWSGQQDSHHRQSLSRSENVIGKLFGHFNEVQMHT